MQHLEEYPRSLEAEFAARHHAEQRVLWVGSISSTRKSTNRVRRGQRRVAWKDAPRLVSKKAAQKFHNAGRLQGIIAQLAEHTTLRAGWGNPQPNGVVRRESSIPQTIRRQVPPEADNCGGLYQEIKMAVGSKVMLQRNIGTEDGLVNGVMRTVVSFEWQKV
jgi:hypothetical protein